MTSLAPGVLAPPQRLLWVEGKDDRAVIQSLLAWHRVPEVFHVADKEGVDKLLRGLPVQLKAPGLERFGVVLDADSDLEARWHSIREMLRGRGYTSLPTLPDSGGTVISVPGLPIFGAWLMPENVATGMLEDFAAFLVPDNDYLWAYSRNWLDALPPEHQRFADIHRTKAHIHAWLALQKNPGTPMGLAITGEYLNADAPHARRFIRWVERLFVE